MKKTLTKGTKQKTNDEDQRVWKVYLLKCPYKHVIRYVGVSKNPEERLKFHLSESEKHKKENPYKYHWVRKIQKLGYEAPELIVVHTGLTFEQAFNSEIAYVRLYRAIVGKDLTNIAPGGFGPPQRKTTPIYQCDEEGNILREYAGIREAARKTNLSYGSINHVLAGRRKTCGGFMWRYAQ